MALFDWIKWVKGLSRRREVLVLARKLGISRREAACACMEVWEWADSETHDGHIQGATRDDIDLMLGLPGFAAAFESQEVGWARFNERGITFLRWERNNGESAKKRLVESMKKRRQRKGHLSLDLSPYLSLSCPQKNGTSSSSSYSSAFLEFWEIWPRLRRESKEKAWQAWKKAIVKAPPSVIFEAAKEYAASPVGRSEFVKMPATWLNKGCWNDDRQAWQAGGWQSKPGIDELAKRMAGVAK